MKQEIWRNIHVRSTGEIFSTDRLPGPAIGKSSGTA